MAAAELSGEGVPVRYVRTTFLPEDETCFHVFEAEAEDAIVEACRLAGIESPRIVRAVESDQNASSRRAASATRSGDGM